MRYNTLLPYDSLSQFLLGASINLSVNLVLLCFNYYIVFRLSKFKSFWKKAIADTAISFLVLIGLNYTYLFLTGLLMPEYSGVDWAGTCFINTFVIFVVEIAYYVRRFKASMREEKEARADADRYKYEALRAQVNPHFLFNSLNILYSLISIDQQKSKDFVLSLSQMYRYILSKEGEEIVDLREELAFLRSYISVLELRYQNQFEVTIENEELVGNQKIIPYTIQLLIENAIKHNIISTHYPLHIVVRFGADGMTVANQIRRKPAENTLNIGLRYLTSLYAHQGRNFRVTDDSTTFSAFVPYL